MAPVDRGTSHRFVLERMRDGVERLAGLAVADVATR
jgi:hypothetical protein